ncbi:hypothetical protein I5462_03210 [Citrobacter freundii]|uniref:hypothetical protein n=1 Tax=Citrobacter freundii TaxID=546 RepID=UPI0015752115|nr:hypothetical protein [Citrobacter freundii]EMB4339662.1 hypothetical protein [Citrobacter freundii]MBJ9040097.1 hypothetical protein [Citrobacter freundii]NTY75692.1 hypothetical protein [Citrobacter freundii]NUA12140.1 hypothetical protein [Citrobacter freundii]HAT7543338.1 hypothetical protein [Citrobacter freundii]
MNNNERISFITPFSGNEELNQPKLNFSFDTFPAELAINFRMGMVGLKPNSRYNLSIMVLPTQLYLKEGESIQFPDGSFETVALYIDTKDGNPETGVSGQVDVILGQMRIPARGLYCATGFLHDNNEPKNELHKNECFFTVELS